MNKDQYIAWMEEADAYAEEQFSITATEVNGGDMIPFEDMQDEDPESWVERKAEKYDLIRLERALGSTAPLSTLGYTSKQEHGTSRVRITTYKPVVENFQNEGDEYDS